MTANVPDDAMTQNTNTHSANYADMYANISAFLNDQLPEPQRQLFIEEMSKNPALARAVSTDAEIADTIRQRPDQTDHPGTLNFNHFAATRLHTTQSERWLMRFGLAGNRRFSRGNTREQTGSRPPQNKRPFLVFATSSICLVLGTLLYFTLPPSSPNQSFDTLTNTTQSNGTVVASQYPLLRITTATSDDYQVVLDQYETLIVARYDAARTMDLDLTKLDKVEIEKLITSSHIAHYNYLQ